MPQDRPLDRFLRTGVLVGLGVLVLVGLAVAGHLATDRDSAPPTPRTAPAPAPAPVPGAVSGGKPGASNTGVPEGTVLRSVSGGLRVTQAGAVIDGLDITGPVVIDAPGVTIRNSKIHESDFSDTYGIFVRSGSLRISDSEVYGFKNGITFDNWTATRVDVHGMSEDGVKLGDNVTLVDSWIHDMTPGPGAHADGGQMQGGSVNVMVTHNNIDMASGAGEMGNAALFLAPDLGPSSNGPLTVKDNWLNGGNFIVQCVDGNNGQYFVKNISIVDNRFGPDSNYGPLRVNVPVTAAGNVAEATGARIDVGPAG